MVSNTILFCQSRGITSMTVRRAMRIVAGRWLVAWCATAMAAAAGIAETQTPIAARAVLHADQSGPTIAPQIYGQFSEHLGRGIYEGIWVGAGSPIPNTRGIRNHVIAALRPIHLPVAR